MTAKQTRRIEALSPLPPGEGWGEGARNISMHHSTAIAEPIAASNHTPAMRPLTPALSRREREWHLPFSRLVVFYTVLLGILTLGCASAQPTAPLTKDSSIDEILDALDARGKNLKSFVCDVRLTQADPLTGIAPVDIGKVFYQLKSNGDGRLYVEFTQSKSDEDAKLMDKKIEYLLDDGKFVERDYQKRTQATKEVLRPGEKLNLLKLGEGPFPLPIGQPKEEVKKAFDVTKIEAAKDDPADTVHLKLIPKPDTRFARQFKTLDTFVDLKQNMPVRIATTRNGDSDKMADLSNVVLNPDLTDRDFALENVDLTGWNKSESALEDRPAASNESKK